MTALLTVRGLCLDTPSARPLIRDLTVQLHAGDRVAIVGRNGVGKSTLLRALAGEVEPSQGRLHCTGTRRLVGQLAGPEGLSPGQAQRRRLEATFATEPDLLLLDEPTHDLDRAGIEWLAHRLRRHDGGLLVVSHDRRLLRCFDDFFVVAESGCRHFHGSLDALRDDLESRAQVDQNRYVRTLNQLVAREWSAERTRRRRERKKNMGRIRELNRATPRSTLNSKRGDAQNYQGKRERRLREQLGRVRAWAKATRRALTVDLPLEVALPQPPASGETLARLKGAGMNGLFAPIDLEIQRDRLAIVGPNGSGKSTLVELLVGERAPDVGLARCARERIAYVAQNSRNWSLEDTLLERLGPPLDDAASLLRSHRFPFALADRPLRELSPGERLRAALVCAFAENPELLVLDEPTDHLDFVGVAALERILRTWRGGLVVVSHDEAFLDAVGICTRLDLAQLALVSKKPTELPSRSLT